ncbi:zinc finger protein Xfin [Stomoxys calcitrans]|uniref:zinc finger protein Xfin n=1 Tax=Stomoxys calcitrans TaxID=35570 RepID=UPI0027E30259|nr:zinc finger protein Xfin [Stomoxys calcitrans]
MEHSVEILSNILLPPCFCYFCKFQIGADMDLRQHYEEYHRHEFLEYYPKESAEQYHKEVSEETMTPGFLDILPQGKAKAKNRRKKFEEHEKPHQCPICKKGFTQRSSCLRHVKELHEQPKSLACDQCELKFNNQTNLRTHLKRIHGVTFEVFKCPHCARIYHKPSSLSRHLLSAHNDIKAELSQATNGDVGYMENDPQFLAENVLQELKQFQKAIAVTEHIEGCEISQAVESSENKTVITSIEDAVVEEIIIKDRLNPQDIIMEHKVQRIKRSDGYYYICEYCSKEFRKRWSYIRHHRTHTKVRPYVCVVCKKSFPTQNELKRHCSTHILSEKKQFYRCPKCMKSFSTITGFDTHISSHTPESYISFNCKQCPKVFSSLKMYFNHNHADPELDILKSLLPSPICMLEGKERDYVEEKQKTNTDLKCALCGLEQISMQALKQHEKRHNNLLKHQCMVCKRFYTSMCTLRVHARIHLNNRKFKCSQCNKKFQTKYDLKRHELVHNNTIKNYKCRYCDQHFKTISYCRSHMMTHLKQLIKTSVNVANKKEATELPQQQVVLQAVVQNNNNLEIVIKNMTMQKKPKRPRQPKALEDFVCIKCGQKFRYQAWLRKHMIESHSTDKPFQCETCFKAFKKMSTLKHHILTHANQEEQAKPTCQVCGKLYANQKSLRVHLRIHTEEKRFKCSLDSSCTAAFRTSGHLASHQKSKHHLNT